MIFYVLIYYVQKVGISFFNVCNYNAKYCLHDKVIKVYKAYFYLKTENNDFICAIKSRQYSKTLTNILP